MAKTLFLVGIVVVLCGESICIYEFNKKNRMLKRQLHTLRVQEDSTEAWNELQTYLQLNKDTNCILLDNFVISKSEGMMRPYEDILWAYHYVEETSL